MARSLSSSEKKPRNSICRSNQASDATIICIFIECHFAYTVIIFSSDENHSASGLGSSDDSNDPAFLALPTRKVFSFEKFASLKVWSGKFSSCWRLSVDRRNLRSSLVCRTHGDQQRASSLFYRTALKRFRGIVNFKILEKMTFKKVFLSQWSVPGLRFLDAGCSSGVLFITVYKKKLKIKIFEIWARRSRRCLKDGL